MATRQCGINKYNVITTNKDCYRHSLYPKTIPEWNQLSTDIRSSPDVKTFKAALDSINIRELTSKAHFTLKL